MTSFFTHVLRFRLLIAAAAIGVLTLGVLQLRNSPVDVLPEFTPPYAEIQTEALGLSAEEVEQLITVPLEADLLNGVEGVEVIRSDSVPGLSSIVMVFAKGTDIYEARLLIQERLTQAHALPNVSRPPTLLPPLSSSNRVLMIGLTSTELSPIEQSVLARWTVRPQLMGVPGVANVSIWGLRDQQLQVQVDPATLASRKVTLNQIVRTTGNAQVVSPLSFLEASTPGTGGFIESPQQRLQVRHLLERIADPAELAKVPVEGTNGALQLGDVSTIVVDHQPLIGDAVVNDGPGLLLVVEKFPGVSTLEVTEGVENALETLRPGLTGMSTDTSVFRPADYISDALDNVGLALLIGGILMLAALLALRLQWRAVVVAVITVPLSIIIAALILRALGQEMNALVLAGLAAALTVVVDEAVTPADHALRRLREQQFEPEPESVPESVAPGLDRDPATPGLRHRDHRFGHRAGGRDRRPARRLPRPADRRVRRGRGVGLPGRDRRRPGADHAAAAECETWRPRQRERVRAGQPRLPVGLDQVQREHPAGHPRCGGLRDRRCRRPSVPQPVADPELP